jgi:hypothetical protein
MSNLVRQMVAIWLLIVGCNGIAHAQKKAEECLAEYLQKYDDFYQEFALTYRGETFSVRKSRLEEKERFLQLEGIVVESVSRGIQYAAWKCSEPIGSGTPSVMEELTIGGRLFSKQYGAMGNHSQIEANAWGGPSDKNPVPKIIPCIQPHGLALLRDLDMRGRESEIRKCVPMRFVEESDLEKGGVRGVWIGPNKDFPYQCTIDFTSDDHPVPVKVIWELVGKPELGKSKCTTITKWNKDGDLQVPKQIEITSQQGEGRTEVRLEFVFVRKERFEKEIKEIKPDFVKAKGTSWVDQFGSWFDK